MRAFPLHTVALAVEPAAAAAWRQRCQKQSTLLRGPTVLVDEGGNAASAGAGHSVLTAGQDQRTMYCPSVDLGAIESFAFDRVYGVAPASSPVDDDAAATGAEQPVRAAYDGSVAHLVHAALRGVDGSLVVSGESEAAKRLVLFDDSAAADVPAAGLLEYAVEGLLAGLAAPGRRVRGPAGDATPIERGTVTVSWFGVNASPCASAGRAGSVTDLLSAALGAAGTSTAGGGGAPLSIRDVLLGAAPAGDAAQPQARARRRAPAVPGLVEVEVSSVAEVRELAAAVSQALAHTCRDGQGGQRAAVGSDAGVAVAGDTHWVCTIAVEERGGAGGDTPTGRVGRVRVVRLARSSSSAGVEAGADAGGDLPWAQQLHASLAAMAQRRPTARIGRERALAPLLPTLRGARRDGPSAWVVAVETDLPHAGETLAALTLGGAVARACADGAGGAGDAGGAGVVGGAGAPRVDGGVGFGVAAARQLQH
eukprot:g5616.t1